MPIIIKKKRGRPTFEGEVGHCGGNWDSNRGKLGSRGELGQFFLVVV